MQGSCSGQQSFLSPETHVQHLRDALRDEWLEFRRTFELAAKEHLRRQENLFDSCLDDIEVLGTCGLSEQLEIGGAGLTGGTAVAINEDSEIEIYSLTNGFDDVLPASPRGLTRRHTASGAAAQQRSQTETSGMTVLSGKESEVNRSGVNSVDSCRSTRSDRRHSPQPPPPLELDLGPAGPEAKRNKERLSSVTTADTADNSPLSPTGSSPRRAARTATVTMGDLDHTKLLEKSKRWEERSILHKKLYKRCSGLFDWWQQVREPPRTGQLARIVTGKAFESICASVILLNAAFTCYSTDQEVGAQYGSETPGIVNVIEVFFLSFYTVELMLKLTVHRLYFFCNQDMQWNVFDTVLVLFSLFDQILTALVASSGGGTDLTFMRTFRILKMAKILRGLRVMKVFSELRLMLNSLLGSILSLFWSVLMLFLIFYIFGLFFVQGVANFLMDQKTKPGGVDEYDDNHQLMVHFGRVTRAMLSLYQSTTGGNDWDVFLQSLWPTGPLYCGLFVFFIAFSQIALLNILTAIFVQNAMKLAQPDKESQALEKLRDELSDFQELKQTMRCLDTDQDGYLTQEEFTGHLREGRLGVQLSVLGLTIKDGTHFYELMSELYGSTDRGILIDDLVKGCMQLRGDATSIEIQMLNGKIDEVLQGQDDLSQSHSTVQELLARSSQERPSATAEPERESLPEALNSARKEQVLSTRSCVVQDALERSIIELERVAQTLPSQEAGLPGAVHGAEAGDQEPVESKLRAVSKALSIGLTAFRRLQNGSPKNGSPKSRGSEQDGDGVRFLQVAGERPRPTPQLPRLIFSGQESAVTRAQQLLRPAGRSNSPFD